MPATQPVNDLTSTTGRPRTLPIPSPVLLLLVPLFLLALAIAVLILVAVRNALLLVSLLLLLALVLAFLFWNSRSSPALHFLHRFPLSDLASSPDGRLVKITGIVSCASHSLESSYEKVPRCVYTSTLLYEDRGFQAKPLSRWRFKFSKWNLAYVERFSVDFYIIDARSGTRVMVKAGHDSKVIPLIAESILVNTTQKNMTLSSTLTKWLGEIQLTSEERLICLKEGYVKEGSYLTVMGLLRRNESTLMIVPPIELISTGCFFRKLLLPADISGLILSVPNALATTSS